MSCSDVSDNEPIISQFCTCHNSWAVVVCAKLWYDRIIVFTSRATKSQCFIHELKTPYQVWEMGRWYCKYSRQVKSYQYIADHLCAPLDAWVSSWYHQAITRWDADSQGIVFLVFWSSLCRDYSGYVLSQWEMTLECNIASHRLSPYTEWSLLWFRHHLSFDVLISWGGFLGPRCICWRNESTFGR